MPVGSKIAVAGATGRVGRHVVDVLEAGGHEVVGMSRALGVDIVTGEGLAEALEGVETIVDAASWPTSDEQAATEFFLTATRNLQEAGERAGVRRIVVVSIIGTDRFSTGYNAAKKAHEQAMIAGPLPVQVLRAAQFHEFVGELMELGNPGRGELPAQDAHAAGRGQDRRRGPRRPRHRPGAGDIRARSRRSPARARRTSSRRRGCSPPAAAARRGSSP